MNAEPGPVTYVLKQNETRPKKSKPGSTDISIEKNSTMPICTHAVKTDRKPCILTQGIPPAIHSNQPLSNPMDTPCAACAGRGTSCCSGYQIFLTPGDVCRIADFIKNCDFFTFEPPVLTDIEPEYDPSWIPLILSSGNQVRVLKRTVEKKCCLASDTGCILPPDRRPLICRLYPYIFIEHCILGIDPHCPISKHREWPVVLERMGMPGVKAKQWLDLLYAEIRGPRDFRPAPDVHDAGKMPLICGVEA